MMLSVFNCEIAPSIFSFFGDVPRCIKTSHGYTREETVMQLSPPSNPRNSKHILAQEPIPPRRRASSIV
jgi:hypothetical protein